MPTDGSPISSTNNGTFTAETNQSHISIQVFLALSMASCFCITENAAVIVI